MSAEDALRAVAWCRLDSARSVALGHGDLIGRLSSAALCIRDPRISEAHAMVSLRGGQLQLLGLRGRFRVAGKVRAEVRLEAGVEIELAAGLTLTVERVRLPDEVLGLQAPGIPAQVLTGTVSLYARPSLRVLPGWRPDAPVTLWSVDGRWYASGTTFDQRALAVGQRLEVDGATFQLCGLPVDRLPQPRTEASFAAGVYLEAWVDTVSVQVGDDPPVVVGGLSGRILAELVAIGGPVSWEALARELWPEAEPTSLRRRWDVALSRLRGRLRALGARPDLVQADGSGCVQVALRPDDRACARDGAP